jgi:hypothetical protein
MEVCSTVVFVGAHDEVQQSRSGIVVATPLDMITRLEAGDVGCVVLSASQDELATFVLEMYPAVRVEVQP